MLEIKMIDSQIWELNFASLKKEGMTWREMRDVRK